MVLKNDLVNELNNSKYYAERELERINQDTSMNYHDRVLMMSETLKRIASIDLALQLQNRYFVETESKGDGASDNTKKEDAHPGQSHGE